MVKFFFFFFSDIGPESTKIFDALCYFLEHVALYEVREIADKKKGDLVDTLFFTPREQEKFNRFEHILVGFDLRHLLFVRM